MAIYSSNKRLCIGTIEEIFFEVDDGSDEMLNESYEQVKECVEKCELNDGNDHLLNEAYEMMRESVERRDLVPENMLHLIRNSPKEIKRNHLLAKIRLIERKVSWSAAFKLRMSDYFYTLEQWPNYAIEILLTKHFGYSERIGLACFMHGNGLRDKDKALNIFQFYNQSWTCNKSWTIVFRKFQALFAYLDEANQSMSETGDHIRNEYYYYDMNLKLTMFYDGSVRTRNGERRKYNPLHNYH